MLCQQSLARLGCGLYPLHAASQPEAVSMGGWVPRSLHHLERARHVCNGLSHASLQAVFGPRKLHTELDGGGLTNALPQFPTGPVAFSQIDVQTAHTGWKHLSTNTSTRMHRHGGKSTRAEFVCSFFALFGICRLQCQTDNHYRSNQIACCPRCLENKLA